jgi:hypothetical protein
MMARTVREAALATRSARLRLSARTKPYWRMIEQGLHVGYRRRRTGGTWIARRRTERGIYREAKLGLADDLQDANGDTVLDFSQAQRNARTWWMHEQQLASGLGAMPAGPYTVARAMADYLEDYHRRGGKASDSIESVARRNILPELGNVSVVKLTTRRLLDWHRAIAERPRCWRSRTGGTANLAAFDRKDPEAVRRRRAAIHPAVGFHVLRHTHASILAMQAVPMAVIARQLGHSDTRMTERHYAHLAPNYVADTIRASFPRLTETQAPTVVPIGRARMNLRQAR